jgi:ubiquinone biosynthesis protein UbiJ
MADEVAQLKETVAALSKQVEKLNGEWLGPGGGKRV